MNIAYIVGSFPCVSETFIVNQIAGIAARGHMVDIYTTCDGETKEVPFVVKRNALMERVHRLYAGQGYAARVFKVIGLLLAYGWRSPGLLLRTLNAIRVDGLAGSLRLLYASLTLIRLGQRRYDVIHAQFGNYGLFALDLVKIGALSGAIVTSFRGYDATQYLQSERAAYRDLFRHGVLFLPVSQTLARRLIEAGCDPTRIQVHHSGIDCGMLTSIKRNIPERDPIRVVTIARLVEKKGVRYAIEAVARVIHSGCHVHYTVVGDGPLRGELERLIDMLGIATYVTLMGWKNHEETLRIVQSADFLIAPSVTAADGDEEGIPNAAKEAMAMGLPVISTQHGGIPELIEDGISGYLVPERDADALAERIAYLIGHPEIWAAMGDAGHSYIEMEYNIDRLNDQLVELYRNAVSALPQVYASQKDESGPVSLHSGKQKNADNIPRNVRQG